MKYNERQYNLNYADCNVKDTTGKHEKYRFILFIRRFRLVVHIIFGENVFHLTRSLSSKNFGNWDNYGYNFSCRLAGFN